MRCSARMILGLTALSAASAPWPQSNVPVREVFISLSDRQMTIMEGDTVLGSYPVAIGRAGFDTPTGEFQVIDLDDNPTGAPAISARWIGFLHTMTRHGRAWLGIHGTENTVSIGRAASHGCIRLRIPDVIEAFGLLAIGDPIHISGSPPREREVRHTHRRGAPLFVVVTHQAGRQPHRRRT